ncbi:MAG: class I SAM-dependent methyltransferase [Verrucomicrobiales bacterium]|nr:class I SAM-dependent methyltransferase [Verrucomicrobiales bacterium]
MWYSLRRSVLRCRKYVPGLARQQRREEMVGPLGHWNELRQYQLTALKKCGLQPDHRLLDVGCGPLQGGIAFIQYLNPGRYVGVDINSGKLGEGYAQIAEFGLTPKNPRLILSKRFGVEELERARFDYIWASQILYYFDPPVMRELLDFIAAHLAPGGRFLGDILGTCDDEFRTERHLAWMNRVQRHTVEGLQALAAEVGLTVQSLGRIDAFGYPRDLNLRSNLLLETRAKAGPGSPACF